MTAFEALAGTFCHFGEAPVWQAGPQSLFWIDCLEPALLRYRPATRATERIEIPLPALAAGLVAASDDALILAGTDGLSLVDWRHPGRTILALPPLAGANDGKCDRQGRLWIGTGDGGGRRPPGRLYRIDPDLAVTAMDTGISIPNGPAFSVDGRCLYLADSAAGTIHAFDLDPATGSLANRRTFAQLSEGSPDGMTVDAAGHLWVALHGGAGLVRLTPGGAVERKVELPLAGITSCCFGGPDLDLLYVTSATCEWSAGPAERTRARAASADVPTLFRLSPPAPGIAETPFRLDPSLD